MRLIYQAKFFYGRAISEAEFAILLRQVDKYKPSAEEKRKTGFDEEVWYEGILQDENYFCIAHHIAELFKGSVRMEIISTESDDDPCHLYLIIDNIYELKWESPCQTHGTFDLQIDTAVWDTQLKVVGDAHGLPWQQPQFHLILNFEEEIDWHFPHYGVFFYGVEVRDLAPIIKRVIETEPEIVKELWGYYYDLMLEIYEKVIGEPVSGDRPLDIAAIFHSPNFRNWVPDKETVQELLNGGFDLLESLNKIWGQRGDPVYLGSIDIDGRIMVYLAARETHHTVNAHHSESPFNLFKNNRTKWDFILRSKCTGYGLPYTLPTFHIATRDYSY